MAVRKYDSSRRVEAAQRTREAILAAAFRLHGKGIFDLETLAEEANVSPATVRKHFPTREVLFEGCTAWGLHAVQPPDLDGIGAVEAPAERTRLVVEQTYAFHEALLGQVWSAYTLASESPAMAGSVQQVEELVELLGSLVVDAWPLAPERRDAAAGFVRGLLSPLCYRALRIHGGLSPRQAVAEIATALVGALGALCAVPGKEAAGV